MNPFNHSIYEDYPAFWKFNRTEVLELREMITELSKRVQHLEHTRNGSYVTTKGDK